MTSEVINATTSPVTINPSNGLASITANGTGDYTLFLQDPYVRLLDFSILPVSAGGPVIPLGTVVWNDDVSAQNNPSLSFYTASGDPAVPTDPSDGILLVTIQLANSTAL